MTIKTYFQLILRSKLIKVVFLSHISDHLRKVSLHELNVKKIALHQMVTHEHHSQPLFGNIKRKFNGFHIWLLFSLTRLWHVHNSRSIFSIFYCEWGNSSCIVFGYQHFIAFIHGEEKLRQVYKIIGNSIHEYNNNFICHCKNLIFPYQ